jgi:hypothetical protein
VTGLFDRLAAAFVAPAPTPELGRWTPPEPPRPPRVAVLCRPGDALAAGGAVALAVAAGGPAAVVVWGAEPATLRAPAGRAARRLALRLADRGHTASATGRLVHVHADTPAEVVRVAAATGDAPSVAVLAAPRDTAADRVLGDHDHVLVAGAGAVAELAAASVARLGVRADALDLPAAPAAAALAAAGLALVGPWRAPVTGALR